MGENKISASGVSPKWVKSKRHREKKERKFGWFLDQTDITANPAINWGVPISFLKVKG